jgi:hypothetical protein
MASLVVSRPHTLRIGFVIPHNSTRYADAVYDYAYWGHMLYEWSVVVFIQHVRPHVPIPQITYDTYADLVRDTRHFDGVYFLQEQGIVAPVLDNVPVWVHSVDSATPQGHSFAVVSDWLARTFICPTHLINPDSKIVEASKAAHDLPSHMSGLKHALMHRKVNVLPFIVTPFPSTRDRNELRRSLGIPSTSIVIGILEDIEIDWVQQTFLCTLDENPSIYGLVIRLQTFAWHPNLIPVEDESFVEACDVMLHAKVNGELFGYKIGKCSASNKPILTYPGRDCAHLEYLNDAALVYHTPNTLRDLLHGLPARLKTSKCVYDRYSKRCSPGQVMEQFRQVFLQQ